MLVTNSEITRSVVDTFGIQSIEATALVTGNQVVGVTEVNPVNFTTNFSISQSNVATGNLQIALPTGKDFYLHMLCYSMTKDATCDQATGSLLITGVVNGKTTTLGMIAVITLTAQQAIYVLPFPKPIKLDKGSLLILTSSYTAGLMSRNMVAYGYVREFATP